MEALTTGSRGETAVICVGSKELRNILDPKVVE